MHPNKAITDCGQTPRHHGKNLGNMVIEVGTEPMDYVFDHLRHINGPIRQEWPEQTMLGFPIPKSLKNGGVKIDLTKNS